MLCQLHFVTLTVVTRFTLAPLLTVHHCLYSIIVLAHLSEGADFEHV